MATGIVAVGVLFQIPGSVRHEREQQTTLRFNIAAGPRFLWNHKFLRTLAVMTWVFNFASGAGFAPNILFAVGPASAGGLSDGVGLLPTASACGAFVGSFLAEGAEARLGRSRSLALTRLGGALFLGAFLLITNPLIRGSILFGGGLLIVLWNVITVSLRQRTVPLRAAAGGRLAQGLGLQGRFGFMGVLTFALLGVMPILTDKAIAAAGIESPADPPVYTG